MSIRNRNQRGQAIIESALVLLVCMAVAIGTIDFGHFLYLHQALTERARVAARYGGLHSYTSPGDAIKNIAVYNAATAPQNPVPMVPGLTTSMVTAELVDSGTDAARVRVTISNFPFTFFSPWIAGAATARSIIASVPYEYGL